MKDSMNNRFDEGWRIDEVFRQGLKDLRPEPSEDLWKGINRKLWWSEISHFTFTNLSKLLMIGGIAVVMTIVTALMVVVSPQPANREEASLSIFASEATAGNNLSIPVSSVSNSSSLSSETTPVKEEQVSGTVQVIHSAPVRKITLASILAAEEPEGISVEEPSVESPEAASAVTGGTTRSSDIISDMEPLHAGIYLVETGSDGFTGFIPVSVPNYTLNRSIPSFFSVDMAVAPEATFGETGANGASMSFASDVGLKFHIGRFSIGTGIGVNYEASDGIYTIDYISKDSIGYYTEVIFYSINNGDPNKVNFITRNVTVYDSIMHIADDRTRNRYTYLQIPVLAGFRMLETSRLGLTAYAGPMVSFLVGKKVAEPVIQYPNARIIRIDNNTPARTNTTWQLLIGLRLDYKLATAFSVFAEPYYKYYFNPIVQQGENPASNPWSVGLGVGIQYNFGRKNSAK